MYLYSVEVMKKKCKNTRRSRKGQGVFIVTSLSVLRGGSLLTACDVTDLKIQQLGTALQ